MGRKATKLAYKAERRKRSQPLKPLGRIGSEEEFALLWTDDHIGTISGVFNQRNHTGAW